MGIIIGDEVDRLHVKRNQVVGCSYLDIVDHGPTFILSS